MGPPDPRASVVVASISGGKDSAALSLWLTEQRIEHKRVFADTGWENAATYEHLAYLETVLGPIERVGYPGGMVALLRKNGMFPSRLRRFCTEQLKLKPIADYLKSVECDVSAVGVRAGESAARAKMPEWEWSKDVDCHVWRPLIDWSEDDVIAIHKRHGVLPNPLYLQGASRVGCWPCVFSRKAEIKLIAETDPARIDQIEALEAELAELAEARMAAKGTALEERGFHAPTFFHTKSHNNDQKGMITIRDAVTWSRTARGGKQLTLIDDAPEGCMRWGMCESARSEGEDEE
jgi:3'-phosphoadenosine 5'-phosphosulfate sulfotransferase (PAPS reductase)/FAD synthetase